MTPTQIALQQEAWGDFVLVPEGRQPHGVVFRPPSIGTLPDLHGYNPNLHPWARIFQEPRDAARSLPAGTFVPSLQPMPSGYHIVAVIALVNPDTEQVVDVQTWYALNGIDARGVDPRIGAPNLLVYWGRRQALPIVHEQYAEEREINALMRARPIEKLTVAGYLGVYLSFVFAAEQDRIGTRILDAVQWTTADGTFWTVQGILQRTELFGLAEQVAANASVE